ncbi:MAG TPA: tripartite tricarboxylate transporter substrate binding protein [Xanthobacteraceae bacterium]|nr:tripartite tricarboxylate transporter substrate binding protein [Xanthobacteraceae bacterium]
MLRIRARSGAIAAAILVAGAVAASAQQWPTRPIRVVSPFPAGSASDTTARVVVNQMAQLLGQSMVVEPQGGAGGIIGFEMVAKAAPDGYTVVTSSTSMATGKVLHSHLPYDVLNDFIPVAIFGSQPNVLVTSKQSGFKSVADLVAAAKEKPGTLTFASAGVGSTSHMAGERFRLATKIDVRHIPFRENGLTEVMAGRIDYYFIPLAAAASALASGKLTVLAVSTPKRAALLPDVPTVAEAGYPGAESNFWVGLSVPAKTPAEIVNKLHDATEKALQDPDVKAHLDKLGVVPELMSAEQFGVFFKKDYEAALQLANDAHIEPAD